MNLVRYERLRKVVDDFELVIRVELLELLLAEQRRLGRQNVRMNGRRGSFGDANVAENLLLNRHVGDVDRALDRVQLLASERWVD